jgi:hypothetical protein
MTTELPAEYLDARTPPDVIVTDVAPPRITDPRLGVPLGTPPVGTPPPPATPARRLVVVGDSLSHGVSSGAVFHTDQSWPAQVAAALGVVDFTFPTYGGPLDGLPFNIESLLRQMRQSFGDDISLLEKLRLPTVLHRIVDANEDYWERGAGSAPPPTATRYDNVGIYGWDVRDALSSTSHRAATNAGVPQKDDLFGVKPDADNDIAAWSVLRPFGPDATAVGAAEWHGAHGGIGTLIVMLGANNALDAVVSKDVNWSDVGYDDLDRNSHYNVWRPTHFTHEYGELVGRLRAIPAQRVVLATVPHVTIAPIANGVNPDHPGEKWRRGSRYFPYYTDPWIEESNFKPSKHRHLTHQQARAIDSAIDQYNATITDAVRSARRDGRDWFVFDLCGLLDALAYRRFAADADAAAKNGWEPYLLPPQLAGLDTRRFDADEHGLHAGGLIGLDMIHPTICGYGIVATEVLAVLTAAGLMSSAIDFAAVRASDTLVSDPPPLVDDVLHLVAPFATWFVSRRNAG